MKARMRTVLGLALGSVAGVVSASLARAAEPANPAVEPRAAETEVIGQAAFMRYCALCHGLDGRGLGPLAEALSKHPPDLTQLAKNNEGKFPASRVTETIEKGGTAGHGSMRVLEWSKYFGEKLGDTEVAPMILDLTLYIEGLQEK